MSWATVRWVATTEYQVSRSFANRRADSPGSAIRCPLAYEPVRASTWWIPAIRDSSAAVASIEERLASVPARPVRSTLIALISSAAKLSRICCWTTRLETSRGSTCAPGTPKVRPRVGEASPRSTTSAGIP